MRFREQSTRSSPPMQSQVVLERAERRVLEYEHPVRLAETNHSNDVRAVERSHDPRLLLQLRLRSHCRDIIIIIIIIKRRD